MHVRNLTTTMALISALIAVPLQAQELTLPRPSPNASVSQVIGITKMSVSYSSPGVKGRTIWGDLVPYDEVWRTGANDATTFTTDDDVMIAGKSLGAGTYALFTVPGEKTWDVVFNSQAEQWGSGNYDPEKDVVRVQVAPQATSKSVERMNFSFRNFTTSEGELVLAWERLEVVIPITVSLQKAMDGIDAAMADFDGKRWQTPYQCATFYFDNDIDADKAAEWAKMSVKVEETYFNTRLMAMVLARQGERKDAIKWGEKAVKLGKMREQPIDTRPLENMVAEWQGK